MQTVGGAGFVRVDRSLIRPSGNELSTNVEREIVQGLSGRVSYVYKNLRNVWGEVDVLRAPSYTIPFSPPSIALLTSGPIASTRIRKGTIRTTTPSSWH